MTEIITLPDNFIGKEDREKLESFAAHTIAHGRATRLQWDKDTDGGDIFEIYPVAQTTGRQCASVVTASWTGFVPATLIIRLPRVHSIMCSRSVSYTLCVLTVRDQIHTPDPGMTKQDLGVKERVMLRLHKLGELTGYTLEARDGEIGKLEQIYFDDHYLSVRYFIVHTGGWLLGKDVLIAPPAVTRVDEKKPSRGEFDPGADQ
jgi:hypothetical protein